MTVGAGVVGAGSAAAEPDSLTVTYSCSFPLIGTQSVMMRITADIPGTIAVGASTPRFAVHAVATVVNQFAVPGLGLIGVTTVQGTADAAAEVTAPQGSIPVAAVFDLARTKIPSSGLLTLVSSTTVPSLTFDRAGPARLTVGGLTLHLAPKNASGDLIPGNITVPCTLNSGQGNVLSSFEITAPPRPTTPTKTGPTKPGPTHSTAPGPTSTKPTGPPTPGPTTPEPTSTHTPTPTVSPTIGPTGSSIPGPTPTSSPTIAAAKDKGSDPTHGTGNRDLLTAGLVALLLGAVLLGGVAFRFIRQRRT